MMNVRRNTCYRYLCSHFLWTVLPSAKALQLPLVVSPASFGSSSPFFQEVTEWLDRQKMPWNEIHQTDFPTKNRILSLGDAKIALHLLPIPTKPSECVPPTLTKQMTDASISGQLSWAPHTIIHLHQDVWLDKQDIVQCRLLAKLGRTPFRIFARKTIAKRIDAVTAMAFLQQHHLWGPTKAKYYYGLFAIKTQEQVAVATFSARRNILRKGLPHKSHELVRYCAKRDGTVVGGISKLLQAFIVDQQPDDIVTLVDRDWGPGSGWHPLGFQTVQIMHPLVMLTSPKDGLRRYIVGAGIQEGSKTGRLGIPVPLMKGLDMLQCPNETFQRLVSQELYPVHDTGVERLMMLVNTSTRDSTKELWRMSVPTYSPTYYSENSGVAALLKQAEQECPPLDSQLERDSMASWRAASGSVSTLVFSAPSSLDPNAIVKVQERLHGWRTVSLVGGMTKSIYHGVYKANKDGTVDFGTNVIEYIRTIVTIALSVLESRARDIPSTVRFLHLGLGAGTLQRLISHYLPESQHVTIELDTGVVAAAGILPTSQNMCIQSGDALAYQRADSDPPFDCICIDVFGADNVLPPAFYSAEFLHRLRDDVLGPEGVVVHNFHLGGDKHARQQEDAEASYATSFKSCYRVHSLDSKPRAGNSILMASKFELSESMLQISAQRMQRRWSLGFNASLRLKTLQLVSPPTDTHNSCT